MTTDTQTQAMPEVIVDRSPELARGAHLVVENAGGVQAVMTPDGARGDGSSCALARIILARFPEVVQAHIEGEHPYLVLANGKRVGVSLGPEVAEWIGRFDRGENPGPMMLQMELP